VWRGTFFECRESLAWITILNIFILIGTGVIVILTTEIVLFEEMLIKNFKFYLICSNEGQLSYSFAMAKIGLRGNCSD
jgi:hypothetical protein